MMSTGRGVGVNGKRYGYRHILMIAMVMMSMAMIHQTAANEIVIDIRNLVNEHRVNQMPGLLDEYKHQM
jgi:hypothetical protein